jgi:hypothetical protein
MDNSLYLLLILSPYFLEILDGGILSSCGRFSWYLGVLDVTLDGSITHLRVPLMGKIEEGFFLNI